MHQKTPSSAKLLLVFVRHPELGKCKTRLAKSIGNEAALEIYKTLLSHTASIIKNIDADKQIWYTEDVVENDLWQRDYFSKKQQHGNDLGERMQFAFQEGFQAGYRQIVIVGSDIYDLSEKIISDAFSALDQDDYVIGPAKDGGYYLLGMNQLNSAVFQNKKWSTASVFKDTLKSMSNKKVTLLPELNDIDVVDDIRPIKAFQKYL
ncbi:TIGR04282 family arsenosugar biosynthesis glycosyltransferase [Mesonia aquimarina]|uniref:TIGR04282 family arsenosugar biosynthesis glycosyltransferase n=1 Tax=Mesonia aquimarina TaxID=1504967 RepID=UPI000EF5A287|nr:TIGR04282 family arsenosugar biosynthesis glycosyltransferase [Mesonia aquimarina]